MNRLVGLFVLIASMHAAAEPGRWTIDYAASRIGFTAEQAQAPFEGAFKTFEADVRFDPNALAASTADVSIDTGSVATADKERDGILKGAGWFEVEQYPQAKFTAKEFAKTKDGFEARGELTLRTMSVPVTFRFTETESGGRVELHGEADLDRFAFNLGLGDWADTKWIGKTVHVAVTLVGTR
jgi:polyisoprenoid-binding protein YceI